MELSCRLSHLSVCTCVCVRKVYCGKTADWIRMPFGVVSGVGRGMGVLDGGPCAQGEGGVSGILFPHCFGGLRHFQAKRTKYSNVHITETTVWILAKFLHSSKDQQMLCGWSRNVENKSKMADGRHLENSKYHHVTVVV